MLWSITKNVLGSLGRGLSTSALRWTAVRDLGAFIRGSNQATAREFFRSNCQTMTVDHGIALVRVLATLKMFVPSDDLVLAPHLALDGYWEYWITVAMTRAIRRGMTVVDVGANVGYYALLASHLVGDVGKVVAFEPNPRLAGLLRRSALINEGWRRVAVEAIALSDAEGTATLAVPRHRPGHASIVGAEAGDERVEVPTTTLDAYLSGRPVDVIKIDVEGAEERVWAGMRATIAANPGLVVFLEYNTARYADPAAFLRRIEEAGFALAYVDTLARIRPVDVATVLREHPGEDWMLALRRR